jgi:outer membrane receptor for ferrienterochelin and colicins
MVTRRRAPLRVVAAVLVTPLVVAAVRPRVARAADPPVVQRAPDPKRDRDGDTVVVTGTRTPERMQRSTVKTDVVTRDEADRRGATNVADALASQPGLVVNPGSYGFLGGVSALQIQGFDRDRVLVLEDGERVVGDVGGAIDLSAIPTGDIDRIEVVSGPTSALYGSAALGGVVNIITAPPRDEGPTGRMRMEGRSLNGVVLQANAAYRRGKPWAAVDFNLTRMDGIEKPVGPDLQVPEQSHRMVGIRAGTSLTPEMDVRIRARQFRDRTDGLETQTTPGLGRFVIDTPAQTDRYTLHVIHTTRIGSQGSNLRLSMGRQWFDNFTARDRRDSPIDERHDRTQRMQSFEATGTIADGTRTWVAGARAEAEHFEQDLTRTLSTSAGPVTTTAPEVLPLSYGIGALYAQVAQKLGDVTVLPGARFESHTRYGSSTAPRLAAAWRITDIVTLRASGGRGFRAPSAKELGFAFDHSAFGYKIFGNDTLKPEQSWGVNADVTVTPDKRMTFRASAYANWVDDLIDLDLARGKNEGGVASYTYTNFRSARTAGGQVDAAFKPAPFLRAESSYAYTWTRDDVNDQPLPGRPPHAVTVSLRVEPGWKMELYARARIVTDAFLDENTRAPGYENFDVRVARELWQKSQLYVGALNLTDVKQDPGRVGDTRSPLGRILYIGLKADFPWEDE